jgi:hypothetical protein
MDNKITLADCSICGDFFNINKGLHIADYKESPEHEPTLIYVCEDCIETIEEDGYKEA